ncbi:hypothetical protein Hanom_Chr04g00342651 [Helianthus anomalus]
MNTLEWKASMDRVESTLFEIINLLKEESRRWATSPILSTPPPVSVISPPTLLTIVFSLPPTSVPVPSPPPDFVSTMKPKQASATTPPTTAIPKSTQKPVPTPLAPTLVPSPQKVTATKSSSKPTPTPILIQTSMVSSKLKKVVRSLPTAKPMTSIKEIAGLPEWRPPWRLMETAPNLTVQLEWRPRGFHQVKSGFFALRTRQIRAGWIVMYQQRSPR